MVNFNFFSSKGKANSTEDQPTHNVILFGASGAGKSSVVNMLAGKRMAKTSNDGQGSTMKSEHYDIDIEGKTFRIYDTAGFDDGEGARVPSITAIVQLYKLLKKLDGVSLLVYCMRGPRAKDSAKPNWMLFHRVICQEQVPIVAVITGLEAEPKRSDWWPRNQQVFGRYELFPIAVACITAIEGRNGVYKKEFRESKLETERVINDNHLPTPWRVEKLKWFKEVFNPKGGVWWLWSTFFGEEIECDSQGPIDELVGSTGMTSKEAKDVVDAFKEVERRSA